MLQAPPSITIATITAARFMRSPGYVQVSNGDGRYGGDGNEHSGLSATPSLIAVSFM